MKQEKKLKKYLEVSMAELIETKKHFEGGEVELAGKNVDLAIGWLNFALSYFVEVRTCESQVEYQPIYGGYSDCG